MYKLQHIKLTNLIGAASILMLAALVFTIILPTVSEGAAAESSTVTLPLEVQNNQMLSLGLSDNKVKMEITPTTADTFSTANVNFTVSTNAVDGYKLYIGMLDDNKTALVNEADGSSATIPSISTPTPGEDLPVNHWGYSLERGKVTIDNTTTFTKVPKGTDVADSQNVKTQDYTLGFATKVNHTLDAGVYRNTMTISAVTNPITISNLNQLVYMQDMTSDICKNTLGTDGNAVSASLHNEPSRQLVDTRDGKVYWVSKLADGNCWMVQNLALDITEAGLSAKDTDITADWNSASAYPPVNTRKGKFDLNGVNTTNNLAAGESTNSWNLGEYVIKNPTVIAERCLLTNGNTMDVCPNQVQPYDGSQDEHYLVGNYYQWNTATAGTGRSTAINASTPSSICPKNWQLPEKNMDKSFDSLANVYGITTSEPMTLPPLYFTRSGKVYLNGKNLSGIGADGYAATNSYASTERKMVNLFLFEKELATQGEDWSVDGKNVRCVAR